MSNENKSGPNAHGKNTKKGASTSEAGQGVKITMQCQGYDTHLKPTKHRSLPGISVLGNFHKFTTMAQNAKRRN